MKTFKDINNKVHEIEEGFEHLLPEGSVEITQAEADDLLAPTAEELEAIRIQALKKTRDDALNALVHDFGDGRIMQTRPKDESNIRNAIEIMEANNIPSIGWSMVDDVKQAVTAVELREALAAGQLAAMAIWDAYNP